MRILGLTWLASGTALFVWFVIKLWQVGNDACFGVDSSAFQAMLIAAGYSSLYIIGASGLILEKTWGKTITILTACVTVLYLVTGGLTDGGITYTIIVISLSVLSIVTITMLLKKM